MPLAQCPKCPFRFDPSAVPAGSAIGCPRCGARFELSEVVEAVEPQRARRHARTPGFGSTQVALAGVGLLIAVALGVAVVAMRPRGEPGESTGQTHAQGDAEIRKPDFNFAFRKPPAPWRSDPMAQNATGVNGFAFKRNEPPGWVAFAVRDYSVREPRPSELKDRMLDQLHQAFENLPADVEGGPAELAGHSANRFPFRAVYRPTGDVCSGEAIVWAHKGIGYWLYTWCPETDAPNLAAEFAAIRAGFRTLTARDTWKPSVAPELVIRDAEGRFQLTDRERVWSQPKFKEPADEDPQAVMVMDGVLKTSPGRGDVKSRAELVVILLKGDGDPLTAGRAYVERRYRSRYGEAGNPVAFAERVGEPEGDPPAGPDIPAAAAVLRLQMTVGGDDSFRSADKLLVISAARAGENFVVAEASCPWKDRSAWERRLIKFVGSLGAAD